MDVFPYHVYNSAADLPPCLDRTGNCGICLDPIDEAAPIPEDELTAPAPVDGGAPGSLRHLCSACAQSPQGAPLAAPDTAVISHTDAKGTDRYHFSCARKHISTHLQDSKCMSCQRPIDTSSLLTKIEAESMRFLQAARQRSLAIMQSARQLIHEAGQRYVGADKGLACVIFVGTQTVIAWASPAWVLYRSVSVGIGCQAEEVACFIVAAAVGVSLSKYLLQPFKKTPIKETAVIYRSISDIPQVSGVRGMNHCSLCSEPLHRAPRMPLDRLCEGSLKTVEHTPICEASVAVHYRVTGPRAYHLSCARKQLHQDVLAQGAAAGLFRQRGGIMLLTDEEVRAVVDIEQSEQHEASAHRFHHMSKYVVPVLMAEAFASGLFPILRGIVQGEWMSSSPLSDVARAVTCAGLANLGMTLGACISLYRGW